MDDMIQDQYDRYLSIVNQMVKDRRDHRRDVPDCGAAPLCMGPPAVLAMAALIESIPDYAPSVIMVAIGELSDARQRLDVQRDCTAQETMRAEAAEERARELEARCQGLQDDLDAYESTADLLRPGLTVTDPEQLP